MAPLFAGYEWEFLLDTLLALVAGFIIGAERESRGKPAGISTHCLVIIGSMTFAFISAVMNPAAKTHLAAQIVTGVGFLGAGMILKSDEGTVTNLTTAASIWFAAGIGMAIGFNLYAVAAIGTVAAFLIPKIPHFNKLKGTEGADKDTGKRAKQT